MPLNFRLVNIFLWQVTLLSRCMQIYISFLCGWLFIVRPVKMFFFFGLNFACEDVFPFNSPFEQHGFNLLQTILQALRIDKNVVAYFLYKEYISWRTKYASLWNTRLRHNLSIYPLFLRFNATLNILISFPLKFILIVQFSALVLCSI